MSNLFIEMFSKNDSLVKECETISEFIAKAPINDGLREHMMKYAEGWNDKLFHTFKHHGFSSRPLGFPAAKNLSEIIEDAKLVDGSAANGKFRDEGIRAMGTEGYAFLGSSPVSSNGRIVPGGHIGYRHAIREDAKIDNKFFCYGLRGNGRWMSTYVKPTPALFEYMMGCASRELMALMKFSCEFSFEAVSREKTVLLIARWHIGSDWLAIFDKEEFKRDIYAMLKDSELKLIRDSDEADARAKSCVDENGIIDKEKAARLGVEIYRERF